MLRRGYLLRDFEDARPWLDCIVEQVKPDRHPELVALRVEARSGESGPAPGEVVWMNMDDPFRHECSRAVWADEDERARHEAAEHARGQRQLFLPDRQIQLSLTTFRATRKCFENESRPRA